MIYKEITHFLYYTVMTASSKIHQQVSAGDQTGSTQGGVTGEVWTSQSHVREARRTVPILPCHPIPVLGARHADPLISFPILQVQAAALSSG